MNQDIALKFLGVGDAAQQALGHASAVVELNDKKLLIDLGPGVFDQFVAEYSSLPDAIFVTHCHLDHIADFERLFIRCWFSKHRPLIFVPVHLIKLLHERVGNYPGALAEGGVNFWQAFHLIPVSETFEFENVEFHLPAARHHGVNSAFSLFLPNCFYYTGDTRPIPEILEALDVSTLSIFHDCSLIGNPSHSGADDLLQAYSSSVLEKLFVYHYNKPEDVTSFKEKGLKCVSKGQRFKLPFAF